MPKYNMRKNRGRVQVRYQKVRTCDKPAEPRKIKTNIDYKKLIINLLLELLLGKVGQGYVRQFSENLTNLENKSIEECLKIISDINTTYKLDKLETSFDKEDKIKRMLMQIIEGTNPQEVEKIVSYFKDTDFNNKKIMITNSDNLQGQILCLVNKIRQFK